jgi:hypothetical protein
MDTLPEFVQVGEEERRAKAPLRERNLTGWETVRFQLEDEPESLLSTAAFAPWKPILE